MGSQLDADLRTLLQYYGEDPASTKPEDLFGIVVSFLQSLLVRTSADFLDAELILDARSEPKAKSRPQTRRPAQHLRQRDGLRSKDRKSVV